jgi:predicted dehydrogenase
MKETVEGCGNAPDIESAQWDVSPRPRQAMPIVVIGAGGIVENGHLPAYALAQYPVVAIADISLSKAQDLAKRFGVQRSFSSVAETVGFAPANAVYDVAVPAGNLIDVLTQLPDGAAVLMQKPMGETLEEARRIRELCHAKRLTAAVNFQLRYAPSILAARAMQRKGLLGEVHDMEVQVRTHMPWEQWSFLAKAPRLEVLYHSIHYVDLIRSWFGDPLRVYAKTVRNPGTPELQATKSILILDYGEWRRAFIATNHNYRFGEEYERAFVQWEGTQGAMRATLGVILNYPLGKPDRLESSTAREARWVTHPIDGQWFPDAFAGAMGSLQAFVEGSEKSLPTSVDDAIRTMKVVEAIYSSSEKSCDPLVWSEL